MAKRYGIDEGTRLAEPIFEFFLKSDALHDPLCNDDHIRVLGWASADEIAQMKALTHKVNAVLKPLFADAGIDLVDYKLEFGHPVDDPHGPLVLGDEFTPDGCRLWDAKTGEKLDKDRFRRDLGERHRALPRSGAAHRRAAVASARGDACARTADVAALEPQHRRAEPRLRRRPDLLERASRTAARRPASSIDERRARLVDVEAMQEVDGRRRSPADPSPLARPRPVRQTCIAWP